MRGGRGLFALLTYSWDTDMIRAGALSSDPEVRRYSLKMTELPCMPYAALTILRKRNTWLFKASVIFGLFITAAQTIP